MLSLIEPFFAFVCPPVWPEMAPLWQNFMRLWRFFEGLFNIWQNCEPYFGNFLCYWAKVHCCKGPNVVVCLLKYLSRTPKKSFLAIGSTTNLISLSVTLSTALFKLTSKLKQIRKLLSRRAQISRIKVFTLNFGENVHFCGQCYKHFRRQLYFPKLKIEKACYDAWTCTKFRTNTFEANYTLNLLLIFKMVMKEIMKVKISSKNF